MRILVDLKIALNNLRATRVRTALTILGVIIGVTSVTTILALAEGGKNVIRAQVGELGNNLLSIRPGKAGRDESGKIVNYNYLAAFGATTITERDLATIQKTEGVAHAAPLMLVTGSVAGNEVTSLSSVIVGTTEDGDEALGLKIKTGEFLNPNVSRETVVLGRNLALELFGSDTAIGQSIKLRGHTFTVIGIMDYFNSSATVSTVFDLNNAAFIPMFSAKTLNQGLAQIQQVNARAADGVNARDLAANLQQKLVANHDGEEDVSVLRPEETIQLADELFKNLSNVIAAIAAISIVVGGVGIMNIMLVSVTERTREIGIRKAVGATNRQILSQFLIEALVMSLSGGFFGVIAGYALAYLVATSMGFLPGFTWPIVGTAFGISLVVGLLFGAWPAIKAARKDPIEALRYFQ